MGSRSKGADSLIVGIEVGSRLCDKEFMRPAFLRLFFGLAVLTALTGCAGKAIDKNDPAVLMKEAEEDISSDHFQIALDKLRDIKNKYPYSKYALDAQLKIADVYFIQESYSEAAASYEAFYDLHPKHEKVPYAMFRAAKSYFNDIPSTIARDLSPAAKALDSFNEFLKRFPQAPEAQEARADVVAARKLLAEKELSIADFYTKRHFYDSARPRYKKVIELYSDTETAKKAQEKLASIEGKISKKED